MDFSIKKFLYELKKLFSMKRLKIFMFLIVSISLLSLVNSATISGTVYDLTLKKANNVVVKINTSTKQVIVAQNGSYSFEVSNGDYTIKSQLMQKNAEVASAEENITISRDGSYLIDLILYPDFEELENAIDEIDKIDSKKEIARISNGRRKILIGLLIIFVPAAILAVFFHFKRRKINNINNEEGDLGQIIKVIKQEGGRITQKEIRKQIPLSEAKISLMIAELEHKNIVEKIKKGRGNIIILKKK